MSLRQAACDPCRRAKLACDHGRPQCERCLKGNKAAKCVYRSSPFRRRRPRSLSTLEDTVLQDPPLSNTPSATTLPTHNPHPNPGHLGSSSHATIFNHILRGESRVHLASSDIDPSSESQYRPAPSADPTFIEQRAAEMLKQLFNKFDFASMKNLIDFWLARGVSLALAEPIVQQCVNAVDDIRDALLPQEINRCSILTRRLMRNSSRPLSCDSTSTLSTFTRQFCGQNIRWETMGIFLLAVVRATSDISFFPPLYKSELERCELQRLATRLSNCALELCLSLNILNDLQLIFQYENMIVCCTVDGDQSLRAWRSLGDVIATIFALGYHEDISIKSGVPPFLVELRRTAFARIYSADKNLSIFLGRPPRMSKRFSYFQMPSGRANLDVNVPSFGLQNGVQDWDIDAEVNYRAETRWSALCASIKEDILELLFDQDRHNHPQRTREIMNHAEAQWKALPLHFRLSGSLKQCTQNPIRCDFLASTRLNYLHVHFLLHLASLESLIAPDDAIVDTAQQILALVVEVILLRDHLANSGTTLIWKVAHYGLPAAGVILLSMLKSHELSGVGQSSRSRVWQDLCVLAAEVQIGTVVRPGDPNYVLLHKATETIQNFLESTASGEQLQNSGNNFDGHGMDVTDEWFSTLNPDPWNLERGFWQSLSEHPFISNADPTFQDF